MKLKIKNLIEIEERLLTVIENEKFTTEFNDYLLTERFLKRIGEITSLFFSYLNDYDVSLIEKGTLTRDERKNHLTEMRDKLLDSDVDLQVENYIEEGIIDSYFHLQGIGTA